MEKILVDNGNMARYLPGDVKDAAQFWTAERMAAAKPLDIVLPLPPGYQRPKETEPTVVEEADVTVSPYSRAGRIFCTRIVEGYTKHYAASAQVCGKKNIILTAAHAVCDKDERKWSDNIVFCRAYKNGSLQEKQPVSIVTVKADWGGPNAAYTFDYAFLILTGECTVDEPFAFETNRFNTQGESIGYPNNFGGSQTLQKTSGPIREVRLSWSGEHFVQMPGNPMNNGCSGGAWIESGSGKSVGLNSFIFNGITDMYGPFFDDKFQSLYDYAESLCK